MTASKASASSSRFSPSITRVSTLVSPAWRAASAANTSRLDAMSVARTKPDGPTRRAATRVCPPAPAATSRTRLPARTPAISNMISVAGPSHCASVGPQRCQASAATCHCSRVVSLYLTGSNAVAVIVVSSCLFSGPLYRNRIGMPSARHHSDRPAGCVACGTTSEYDAARPARAQTTQPGREPGVAPGRPVTCQILYGSRPLRLRPQVLVPQLPQLVHLIGVHHSLLHAVPLAVRF